MVIKSELIVRRRTGIGLHARYGVHSAPRVFGMIFLGVFVCMMLSPTLQAQTNTFPSSGSVGIGTTSPASILEVVGTALVTGSSGALGVVDRSTSGTGAFYRNNGVNILWDSTAGDVISYNTSGNVGIGTYSPASKLDVNGDITVSGNINAKYQDVAEWVPSPEKLSTGSVVVLSPGLGNSVIPSSKEYDTRVAGVVSANPGILLGEGGEGKYRIATTGRVKVHVDASAAPIEVGDLLVTSSMEGTAMKSQPVSLGGVELHRPGTLIGKALEPLSDGEGDILVLLSLQ